MPPNSVAAPDANRRAAAGQRDQKLSNAAGLPTVCNRLAVCAELVGR